MDVRLAECKLAAASFGVVSSDQGEKPRCVGQIFRVSGMHNG